MKFNELLAIYNSKKARYKSLLLELQELQELGTIPRRGESLGVPTQRSASSSVENYVIKVDEIERRLKEIDSQMLTIRDYIQLFIQYIENEQAREVVENCVFRNSRTPNWHKIARRVNYSETHTRRLYNEGIDELENLDLEVKL